MITYNGVFVVGQSNGDISDCRGLRDIVIATNFWPKYAKILQNSHICDILTLVHSALNPCKLTDSNSTPAYERKTANINVKNSNV